MYLVKKFEYGNKSIPFNDRYQFASSRNIKHIDRYEKLLGEGNYSVYTVVEKIGYRQKAKVRSLWVLMTDINNLNKHYEFKKKGEDDV